MKKIALTLTIICLFTSAGQTYAACKSEACRQAVAWKDGYTAIVLDDDITPQGYMAVLDAVKANKGTVAIETDGVLLGWIPKAAIARLRNIRSVRAVEHEGVPKPESAARNPNAIEALSFFNRVVSGEYEDVIETGLWIEGAPLTGCVVPNPRTSLVADAHDPSRDPHAGALEPRPARRSVVDPPVADGRPAPKISPNWGWREPFQNPDMRGRISVQVFRLDSNGTVDPNLYTWTSADMATSRDQVYGAFNFWASQAAARGITLSFRINIVDIFSRYTRQYVPTSTNYEPITRSSTQDYLWINDALQARGYGASAPVTMAKVYDKNEEFNRAHKTDVYGNTYDRSFTVFIVYNPGSAPLLFANGMRAYAKEDGPFTMVMWNSGGWGPENLGKVITHETGHIFWACDEYHDVGSSTGCFSCANCWFNVGPRNQVNRPDVTNANCKNANPDKPQLCAVPRVYCIMDSPAQNALCRHTPGQVGW